MCQADGGGKRVGIIGIGGLGQMGVRLAKAMGNTVTAISTSPNKEAAARWVKSPRDIMRLVLSREIGAENFVVSSDPESMKKAAGSLDLILNTVSHQGFLLADRTYKQSRLLIGVFCPMTGERWPWPEQLPGSAGQEGGDSAAGPSNQPTLRGSAASHVQEDQHRWLTHRGAPWDPGMRDK